MAQMTIYEDRIKQILPRLKKKKFVFFKDIVFI